MQDVRVKLTFESLAVSLHKTRLKIKKFYMVFALRWVFCTDLRTDSDFCFMLHQQVCFYNRGGRCLLRGTNWFFMQSGLRLRLTPGLSRQKQNSIRRRRIFHQQIGRKEWNVTFGELFCMLLKVGHFDK